MLQSKSAAVLVFSLGLGVGCGSAQEPGPVGPSPTGKEDIAKPAVKPIPDEFSTLTPALTVSDIDAALDWYVRVLAAEKRFAMPGPDGKTMHAEIKIGDSIIMLGSEHQDPGLKSPLTLGGSPGSLTYYVPDVDAAFKAAVDGGAKVQLPVQDMFWGDRYGQVVDPFGHRWAIATHKEDLTREQMRARGAATFGGDGGEAAKTPGKPATKPIPDGYHTLTPGIVVSNAAASIEFYKAALGATERERVTMPDGRVMHAELQIGDSILMLSDPFPEMGGPKPPSALGGSPFSLLVYVEDVDAAYARAVAANAKTKMPVTNMFWGDRWGSVIDPSGYEWGLATHVEDVPPEQMAERMQAQMQQMGHAQEGHDQTESP